MAETADLLAGGRWSLTQSWSLVLGGLGARRNLATGEVPSAAVARGAALGYLVWVLLLALRAISRSGGVQSLAIHSGLVVAFGFLAFAAGVAVAGARRSSALVVTVVMTYVSVPTFVHSIRFGSLPPVLLERLSLLLPPVVLAATAIGLVWWLALRHPGARAVSVRGLGALLAGMALLAATGQAPNLAYASPIGLMALPLLVLLLSAVNPRVAVAATMAYALEVVVVVPGLIDRAAFGGPRPDRVLLAIAVSAVLVVVITMIGVRRTGRPAVR